MAENEQAVDQFLKSIMTLRYGSAEGKLGQQKLAMAQQRLNAEQANHAADMKQRADQFGQEMDYRKQQAQAEQAFRTKTLEQGEAARQDASQERFRAAGGQLFDTPTDKTFSLNVNPMQSPNPASVLMPRASTQPVGPQPNLEQASMADPNNLPMQQQPQVPIQLQLPADAQGPDPERYSKTVAPLGTPAGQTAYFPTLKGKTLEAKEAADEADQMTVTPEMERVFGDMHLKAGDTVRRSLLPLMENAANRQLTREATSANQEANRLTSNDQKDRDRDLKVLLGQLAAQKKGDAGADDIQEMTDSVVKTGDPKSIPAKFKPQVTADLAKRYKLPFPSEAVTGNDNDRVTAAQSLKQFTRSLEENLSDPILLSQLSPLMGRAALMQEQAGKNFGLDPEHEAKMQTILNQLNSMNALDVRAQIGGRASYQMFQAFKDANPNARMDPNMFMGALHGMEFAANAALQSVNEKRWGVGNAPPGFKESLVHNQVVIPTPNPKWANPKDKANYIPLGTIRTFPDPDKPGSSVKIRRNIEDGKYYEVKD